MMKCGGSGVVLKGAVAPLNNVPLKHCRWLSCRKNSQWLLGVPAAPSRYWGPGHLRSTVLADNGLRHY